MYNVDDFDPNVTTSISIKASTLKKIMQLANDTGKKKATVINAILEGFFIKKQKESNNTTYQVSPNHNTPNAPKVDIKVLGKTFTSKQIKELYVNYGYAKRSAEVKIERLKKEGKIESIGRGKYKVL